MIRERGSANPGQVDAHHSMLDRAERLGYTACGLKFGTVALAVVDAQCVAGKTLGARDGERGGGVETA